MIAKLWKRLVGSGPAKRNVVARKTPTVIICEQVPQAFASLLDTDRRAGKEGIAYLMGLTTGTTTLISSVIRPASAKTTVGSFFVDKPAMAKMVRIAADLNLQIVGQIHSHPGEAYHSAGDIEGARIAFPGFVSLVVPDYGLHLPELTGMAAYFYRAEQGFEEINPATITLAPTKIR